VDWLINLRGCPKNVEPKFYGQLSFNADCLRTIRRCHRLIDWRELKRRTVRLSTTVNSWAAEEIHCIDDMSAVKYVVLINKE
jgi:hypothetical protein